MIDYELFKTILTNEDEGYIESRTSKNKSKKQLPSV